MDYEGSRLYDEYPDKYMIYHLLQDQEVWNRNKHSGYQEDFLDELIQVMLCQEISRRRCPQISLQEILLKQIVIARKSVAGTPDSYNRLYNINRQKEQ